MMTVDECVRELGLMKADTQKKKDALKARIEELRQAVQDLKAEWNNTVASIRQSLRLRQGDARKQIAALQSEIEQLKARADEQLRSANASFENRLCKATDDYRQAQRELRTVMDDYDASVRIMTNAMLGGFSNNGNDEEGGEL